MHPAPRDGAHDVTELLHRIPTPSTVALRVLRLVEDERTEPADLTEVLERDPALVARVLRLANSAFYSRGRTVPNLDRAAMILGFRTLKVVVLGFAIADGLPKRGVVGGLDLTTYWTRSIGQAVAARGFAALVGARYREEAYLSGLLAEIGRVGYALALPHEYEALVAAAGPWPSPEQEQAALGMSSADFGSLLLGSWGLPSLLAAAPLLALGHDPRPEPAGDEGPHALVLALAHEAVEVVFAAEPRPLGPVYDRARAGLGIPAEVVDQQLRLLQHEIESSSAQLGIDPPIAVDVVGLLERARRVAAGLRSTAVTAYPAPFPGAPPAPRPAT
jgi:HD-like signal output (HDOD) protein